MSVTDEDKKDVEPQESAKNQEEERRTGERRINGNNKAMIMMINNMIQMMKIDKINKIE